MSTKIALAGTGSINKIPAFNESSRTGKLVELA